jgi:hypothetical protein
VVKEFIKESMRKYRAEHKKANAPKPAAEPETYRGEF